MRTIKTRPELACDHILDSATYALRRELVLRRMHAIRMERSVAFGPGCIGLFENWETLWHVVQEAAYLESLSPREIGDEVRAHAPLVPGPDELVLRLDFDGSALPEAGPGDRSLLACVASTRLWLDDQPVDSAPAPVTPGQGRGAHTGLARHLVFSLRPAQSLLFISCRNRVDLAVAHPCCRARVPLAGSLRMRLAADWRVHE